MSEKKREIWPIAIVASFAIFICGIVTAVVIMVNNDVPLTSSDYYAKEIAYQTQIEKSSRGMTPDQKPEIKSLPASEAVEIRFPENRSGADFSGKATFFRPSDPKKDFTLNLQLDSTGIQWISMRDRSKGLWLLQLEWKQGQQEYYYEEQFGI